jgi:hypothetical protein
MQSVLVVEGFHGTTLAAAQSILHDGFKLSEKRWDWLGDGVYFFQDGPYRAREWALEWAVARYGGEAAVLGASIRLERATLMDLIDTDWSERLKTLYLEYVEYREREGKPIPQQNPKLSGRHDLDRDVVNFAVRLWGQKGTTIRAVRGAFEEGDRVYENSAFYDRAHVQIAVRDVSLIENPWIEQDIE